MPRFIPGLQLSELFYRQQVKPILEKNFPRLKYSAALIGWGSEVLGLDTTRSTDHHWGPRVLLFLSDEDHQKLNRQISEILSENLPYEFLNYSTNYSNPEPNGVRHPVKITSGPVNHLITIFTLKSFFNARLGFDPAQKISVADWLTCPQQRLLEVTSGMVYHDGLGNLQKVRRKLSFYPRDVWLYMLVAQWTRISQEEAFIGRCAETGDEVGSLILGARIVRELMKLTFLMERQYAPYSKWLGSAFGRLNSGKKLLPMLRKVLNANDWPTRERCLAKAYTFVAEQHNALKITKPISTLTSNYFERPYTVIHADRFAAAIKLRIRDAEVQKLTINIGSIDQFTDSTNVVENRELCKKLKVVYR